MLWRIDVDKTHQLDGEMWIQQTAAVLVNHWRLSRATISACRLQSLFTLHCVFSLFTLIKYTHCKDWLKHASQALICHFYMTARVLFLLLSCFQLYVAIEGNIFSFGCFLKRDSGKTKLLFLFFKSLSVGVLGWFLILFFSLHRNERKSTRKQSLCFSGMRFHPCSCVFY